MRAAIYCRVSTEDQARGVSLDAQERACRELVEREGFDDVRGFADVLSGARADRPRYVELLEAAIAGELDVVVVWKFDRFGRDAEELLRARRMLAAADVRLVSATEGEAETMLYGIGAIMSQVEREKIAERTRAGLAEVARSGRQPGGQPPLGYRAVGAKRERRWIVDQAEAELVRTIHRLYLEGAGFNKIAATLNATGHRTRRGARFSPRVLVGLVGHPSYVGAIAYKGKIVAEGAHEPILDRETWDAVWALREAKRASSSGGRGRPPKGSHVFTRGLLRCGRCGRAMTPKTNTNGWEHYRCSHRLTGGLEACTMPSIGRRKVDEAFLRIVERHVDAKAVLAAIREEGHRRIAEALSLAEQAERAVAELEAGRIRADRDYLASKIEADDYRRLVASVEEEAPAARSEAEQHRARAAERELELDALDASEEAVARFRELQDAVAGKITSAESIAALRACAETLLERVVLEDDPAGGFMLNLVVRRISHEGLDFALRLPNSKGAERSFASWQALSGSPTIENAGTPRWRWASTSTVRASSPTRAWVTARASTARASEIKSRTWVPGCAETVTAQ